MSFGRILRSHKLSKRKRKIKMEEITNKEVREKLKKLMEAPPSSPYEVTRKFLSIYFGDADGWDEAIQNIKQFISQRPDVIAKDLQES